MKLKLKQRRWGKDISGMLTRAAGPGLVWQCDTSLVFKLKHMINKHGDDGEAPKTRFKVYSQIYSQLLTLFFLYLFTKYWLTNDTESLPRSWPIRVITSSVIMSLSRPTKRVSRQSWRAVGGLEAGLAAGLKLFVCHWSLMRRESHPGQSAVTGCTISPDAAATQHINSVTNLMLYSVFAIIEL